VGETGNIFDTLFEKLGSFLRSETVVGDPIQVGNVTLIPIVTVSFGVGGGEGTGRDHRGNDGTGGGGGVGCRISPNAVLVIKDDEISLVSLAGKGSLEKIMNMVPELVEKMNFHRKSGDEKKD
jgi:uncharacterized spore protein YtfJ